LNAAQAVATPRGRILIVDDYADARSNLREALEQLDYEVFEAANGQQALHFLVSRASPGVELIVLDLEMPVMNGWRLLELLDTYVGLRRIPVLIASVHPPRLSECKHQHIVGVLHVPYSMEDLTSKIEALLAH
jgi:putative two-component system response regulator